MPEASTVGEEKRELYHCGTLTYTKIGLVSLFIWLLWGDFCYTLMETVVPSIIPLTLKGLSCPNWIMGMIISTIPNFMSMTVAPYVSVKSDRCRTRWGRRIPFIAASMPFLTVSLFLLGWSREIAEWLRMTVPGLEAYAPATVAIGMIGIFMLIFQFFNQFLNTGFWALFNDVVPPTHLARFAGAFRMVGTAAGAFYNYFLFRYAESHSHEIFAGSAILYTVGFLLLLSMVKEGKYPPLDESQTRKVSRWQATREFFRESFHERLYQLIFASGGVLAFAGVAWGFQVFFLLEMKMDLEQIGKYNAILAVAAFIATYFAAIFVDRWHPLRVYTYVVIFSLTGPMMNWVWLFIDLPGRIFFWLSLAAQLLYAFMNALSAACAMPMQMRLFPHSRYGQFGAAQGMIRSACTIAAGMVVGGFYDLIQVIFANCWHGGGIAAGAGYCYRFYFVWSSLEPARRRRPFSSARFVEQGGLRKGGRGRDDRLPEQMVEYRTADDGRRDVRLAAAGGGNAGAAGVARHVRGGPVVPDRGAAAVAGGGGDLVQDGAGHPAGCRAGEGGGTAGERDPAPRDDDGVRLEVPVDDRAGDRAVPCGGQAGKRAVRGAVRTRQYRHELPAALLHLVRAEDGEGVCDEDRRRLAGGRRAGTVMEDSEYHKRSCEQ